MDASRIIIIIISLMCHQQHQASFLSSRSVPVLLHSMLAFLVTRYGGHRLQQQGVSLTRPIVANPFLPSPYIRFPLAEGFNGIQ